MITSYNQISFEDLCDSLRKVTLMGHNEFPIYASAQFKLVTVDPVDIVPAQRYVLRKGVETIHSIHDAFQHEGIDVFKLEGGLQFWLDSAELDPIPFIPPIVEIEYDGVGNRIMLLNDGMHRVYAARERGVQINVIEVTGIRNDLYPYYAQPLSAGWDDVVKVDEVEKGFVKKHYRDPDNYKSLFRNFNSVLPGVQKDRSKEQTVNPFVGAVFTGKLTGKLICDKCGDCAGDPQGYPTGVFVHSLLDEVPAALLEEVAAGPGTVISGQGLGVDPGTVGPLSKKSRKYLLHEVDLRTLAQLVIDRCRSDQVSPETALNLLVGGSLGVVPGIKFVDVLDDQGNPVAENVYAVRTDPLRYSVLVKADDIIPSRLLEEGASRVPGTRHNYDDFYKSLCTIQELGFDIRVFPNGMLRTGIEKSSSETLQDTNQVDNGECTGCGTCTCKEGDEVDVGTDTGVNEETRVVKATIPVELFQFVTSDTTDPPETCSGESNEGDAQTGLEELSSLIQNIIAKCKEHNIPLKDILNAPVGDVLGQLSGRKVAALLCGEDDSSTSAVRVAEEGDDYIDVSIQDMRTERISDAPLSELIQDVIDKCKRDNISLDVLNATIARKVDLPLHCQPGPDRRIYYVDVPGEMTSDTLERILASFVPGLKVNPVPTK